MDFIVLNSESEFGLGFELQFEFSIEFNFDLELEFGFEPELKFELKFELFSIRFISLVHPPAVHISSWKFGLGLPPLVLYDFHTVRRPHLVVGLFLFMVQAFLAARFALVD